MADRLIALKAVLEELGVPLRIDTVQDRLVIQKAVYLAQTQIPLGYSYGWYLKGPYSTRLTKDYYEFAQSPHVANVQVQLKDSVKSQLRSVKDLIASVPNNANMSQWLETLASVHYLWTNWRLDQDAVRAKIAETKPHLNHLVDSGWEALQH